MKILAVGAHLDDIEIACGGTLAKAVDNGHDVKVLIMSKSGYTNKDGKMQRLDEVAVEEGTKALQTLGIQNIEILNFPTKDIPWRMLLMYALQIMILILSLHIIRLIRIKHTQVLVMQLLQRQGEGIQFFFMNQFRLLGAPMLLFGLRCMWILDQVLKRRYRLFVSINQNITSLVEKIGLLVFMRGAASVVTK